MILITGAKIVGFILKQNVFLFVITQIPTWLGFEGVVVFERVGFGVRVGGVLVG